jgi:hypothetical protein
MKLYNEEDRKYASFVILSVTLDNPYKLVLSARAQISDLKCFVVQMLPSPFGAVHLCGLRSARLCNWRGSGGRWQALCLPASGQPGQDAVQPLKQVSGREPPRDLRLLTLPQFSTIGLCDLQRGELQLNA